MAPRALVLLIVFPLLASGACFAQDLQPSPDDDSTLTADQWRKRVQDARQRSEEFVATVRTQPADPSRYDNENAEAADQRAMNDPSLQRGDIVSTSKGFLLFIGRDTEERQPSDFLPAPESAVRTVKPQGPPR